MPFKLPSLLYVVIGLVVVFIQDYLDNLGTISRSSPRCSRSCSGRCSSWASTSASTASRYHPRRSWPESESVSKSSEREEIGTRVSKRLRKQGLIPGVLYGRSEPHSIAIPERELRRALTSEGGLNAILDVVLEGQKTTHPSILKEYQQDPVKGRVTHVDFQEVRLDKPIHATVPVHLVGGGLAGHQRGRRALADLARRQRRGAADGDPRAPRSRRQRHAR